MSIDPTAILPRSFYDRPTLVVARELLGAYLVKRENAETWSGAMIVETEAYRGRDDKACHAAGGKTARNEVMFGPPGHAYVYFTYGMHHCLNAVTEALEFPAAVLLRAAQPLLNLESMRERRTGRKDRELLAGPGCLCAGLGIDRSFNTVDLTHPDSRLRIVRGQRVPNSAVDTSSRVGLSKHSGDSRFLPWRTFVRDSPYLSRGRPTRQ